MIYGDAREVRRLIEAGVDVGVRRSRCQDYTPIAWAALDGRAEIAKMLIDAGTEVNIRVFDDETPLFLATANNHASTAKLLIEHGADVNALQRHGEDTILYQAIMRGSISVLNLLLDAGVDLNAPDGSESANRHRTVFCKIMHTHSADLKTRQQLYEVLREKRPEEFMEWWMANSSIIGGHGGL